LGHFERLLVIDSWVFPGFGRGIGRILLALKRDFHQADLLLGDVP
jgi:hypothetical protein